MRSVPSRVALVVALALTSLLGGCGPDPSAEGAEVTSAEPQDATNWCAGKANGWYCSQEYRYRYSCYNQQMSRAEWCDCGCSPRPAGQDDVCAPCDFCAGKANGYWCDGRYLKGCVGGATVSSKYCSAGCRSMPAGTDDRCN